MIVFRGHKDEGVGGIHRGTPGLGMGVFVLAEPGMLGLIKDGQVKGCQIDILHIEHIAAFLLRVIDEPFGDRRTHAGRPGTAGNDIEFEGHAASPYRAFRISAPI